MEHWEKHEVQILCSEVIKEIDGSISFIDHSFNVDDAQYFYPASTVKLIAAILALEELNKSNQLAKETPYTVGRDTIQSTIADDIQKIFAISDNEAFNRLYEFLGPDHINKRMENLGIQPFRLAHRLAVQDADNDTLQTIHFKSQGIDSIHLIKRIVEKSKPLKIKSVLKGNGYYKADSLIKEPFDFSLKNYYPVHSLHETMKRIMFQQAFEKSKQFNLDSEDLTFIQHSMQLLPKELGYDTTEYYDSYGKFFLFGDSKQNIPDHISIYNKVGYAYGSLTDCAYIIDTKTQVEFILTATLLVNDDQIFNDDQYEYDDIGIPFLAELGREIHAYLVN